MKKKLTAQQRADKQQQTIGGTFRRASDVTLLLEGSERGWSKAVKRIPAPIELTAEELEPTEETHAYLGTMNGMGAKTFCKTTNKMIGVLSSFGIRYSFDNNCFFIAVEKVTDLKMIAKFGSSNSVPSDKCKEDSAQVFYQEGTFYLFAAGETEPIYTADTWKEFELLVGCIPVFFDSRLKYGRLKHFNWENYQRSLIAKHKRK